MRFGLTGPHSISASKTDPPQWGSGDGVGASLATRAGPAGRPPSPVAFKCGNLYRDQPPYTSGLNMTSRLPSNSEDILGLGNGDDRSTAASMDLTTASSPLH